MTADEEGSAQKEGSYASDSKVLASAADAPAVDVNSEGNAALVDSDERKNSKNARQVSFNGLGTYDVNKRTGADIPGSNPSMSTSGEDHDVPLEMMDSFDSTSAFSRHHLHQLHHEHHHVSFSDLAQQSSTDKQRKAVRFDRKKELLLEARENRKEWIAHAPFPYRKQQHKETKISSSDEEAPDENNAADLWNQHESLSAFRNLRATSHLPSSLTILAHLYGMDNQDGTPASAQQVADRIEAILGPKLAESASKEVFLDSSLVEVKTTNDANKIGKDIVAAELVGKNDDLDLKNYHKFWCQLHDPACATLVQGMKNFCRKLQYVTNKEEVIARLKSLIQSTFQTLQSNPLWKKDGASTAVRNALESFIYVQSYNHIESIIWTTQAKAKEESWIEKLNNLHFVTAKHLDITCFDSFDDIDLNILLKDATEALLSVNLYCSAYDKLQRILAVYKGVNSALSTALNKNRASASSKLPSADDVLPTIILTVLRTRPEKLLMNLQLVEDFSPPEYLRGEAGYAYTNLYGAVQFLQDLDLNDPKNLSIDPKEFRQALESSRQESKERIRSTMSYKSVDMTVTADAIPETFSIPPIEIRKARQRGETINLAWVERWHAEQSRNHSAPLPSSVLKENDPAPLTDDPMETLPAGFTRSYTFLAAQPEDIKLSDLPTLLSEYKMLVYTTEKLLAERTAKAAAERKASSLAAERELYERARRIDPSLLPKMNGLKK